MEKVLLTGASGFIGKHIALELINQGYSVRASVRNNDKALEVRNALEPFLQDSESLDKKLSFVYLDLEDDTGWVEAMNGVDVLVHTASPFPIGSPKDENELIRPAVNGTLRALKVAHKSGVRRVILTSSINAINGRELPEDFEAFNETFWTDINHPAGSTTYTKSKTLAERAAWDFIKNEASEIDLTTINPVLVLGAPLDENFGSSISLVERIFKGKDPMLPNVAFSVVSVKDIARMHVDCIKIDATKNQRLIGSSGLLSFVEMAKLIKQRVPNKRISTLQAPNIIIRFLSLFDNDIKTILPLLGDKTPVSASKAQSMLNMQFISKDETIEETVDFLLKLNNEKTK